MILSIQQHLLISCNIRIVLLLYGLVHDEIFVLQYTDIDYTVFTDGARYMKDGRSPYLRHGYRYSPLFAFLTLPNIYLFRSFGKILFIMFDIFTGYIIYKIALAISSDLNIRSAKIIACLWLYNPLPIIISTRGSGDSLVTFPVLLTILFLIKKKYFLAGLLYGISIHLKLYPIIYSLAFFIYLSGRVKQHYSLKIFSPFKMRKLIFFLGTIISFSLSTGSSYFLFKKLYLEEAWIYHFKRKDLAHNFSPYFYLYKLFQKDHDQQIISILAFIPQLISIIYYSLKYCTRIEGESKMYEKSKLMFALFSQTYLFVTLNKVCTSQYFLWYLSLLPFIYPLLKFSTKNCIFMFCMWILGQMQWLLIAYLVEYMKWNIIKQLWFSSILFLLINLIIQFVIENNILFVESDKKVK